MIKTSLHLLLFFETRKSLKTTSVFCCLGKGCVNNVNSMVLQNKKKVSAQSFWEIAELFLSKTDF
jgi:hypothetical protein